MIRDLDQDTVVVDMIAVHQVALCNLMVDLVLSTISSSSSLNGAVSSRDTRVEMADTRVVEDIRGVEDIRAAVAVVTATIEQIKRKDYSSILPFPPLVFWHIHSQ